MDGYTLRSDATPGSVTVTVKNGVADPSNIIFLFKKEEIPAQQSVTGTVQVYYQAIDNSWTIDGGIREFSPGSHYIYPDVETYQYYGTNYTLIGDQYAVITVYDNGVVSSNPVFFYFEKSYTNNGTQNGGTAYQKPKEDPKAVICKQPIFPRPGPNLGKNEYNYDEVIGQEVTVHTRAMSQSGTNRWWVCFSGDLCTEGRVFHLDHMWISESYLDPNSYDLYSVPIDPQYPN